LVSFFPNYYLYYNSFIGGPEGAKQVTVIGWGEGHREAAMFIQQNAGEGKTIAVAGYPRIIHYYYPTGTIVSLKDWQKSDYLIVYVNWLQRNQQSEIAQFISDKDPVHIVVLSGCALTWIYDLKNSD
jgi:hypothetical protein